MQIFDIHELPLAASILIFVMTAIMIGFAGTRLSALADRLADLTGMGEALMGGIFLGASTSLAGITASVTAAVDGYAHLSLSNAIGGIAAQLVMVVIADASYRSVNLEHASASLQNMLQGALLIVLLGTVLFAMVGPSVTFFGIHIVTPILPLMYILGMRLVAGSMEKPMWRPTVTQETRRDVPDEQRQSDRPLPSVWLDFAITALVVMVAGWLLTNAAEAIASETLLSESIVGGLFVAVVTSIAELVTAIAAVQRGALTLAISDIVGGNAFDTLFTAVADVFYREGSIYHAASPRERSLLSLTIVMSAVLLLGLMKREKKGFGSLGFESVALVVLYAVGIVLLNV